MRLHRFYIEQSLGEDIVTDNKKLLHQWFSVFRYKNNNEVILFSGDGYDYTYRIANSDKKEANLSFVSRRSNILPSKNIKLYISIIKNSNFEDIVKSCTEIGINLIIPIVTERSEKKNINKERLETITTEASEQCGRGNLPIINEVISFKEAINLLKKEDINIAGSLNGENFSSESKKWLNDKEISLFVGPEGGWTPSEEESLKEKEVTFVKLTETTLRAETAAPLLCGLIMIV